MEPERDELRSERGEVAEERALVKAPWVVRVIRWYYLHPLLGYALLFGVSAAWAFTPHHSSAVALTVFLLPWLIFGLAVLHLPLLRSAFKRLTLPLPVRRNHALEHGTIQLLRREYGVAKGLAGSAEPGGFLLVGAKNQGDIERAFAEFVALPHDRRLALAVADNCGSMVIVAQGMGILLMMATLLVIVVWNPQPQEARILLMSQLLLFVLGRRPLGRSLQARRFLSVDFLSARIQRIERVQTGDFEKPLVFFVHTEIDSPPSR